MRTLTELLAATNTFDSLRLLRISPGGVQNTVYILKIVKKLVGSPVPDGSGLPSPAVRLIQSGVTGLSTRAGGSIKKLQDSIYFFEQLFWIIR